jgi:hypothetical protein
MGIETRYRELKGIVASDILLPKLLNLSLKILFMKSIKITVGLILSNIHGMTPILRVGPAPPFRPAGSAHASNHCQMVAPNIHVLALLHRPKKRPHMDLVGSQRDNLQK